MPDSEPHCTKRRQRRPRAVLQKAESSPSRQEGSVCTRSYVPRTARGTESNDGRKPPPNGVSDASAPCPLRPSPLCTIDRRRRAWPVCAPPPTLCVLPVSLRPLAVSVCLAAVWVVPSGRAAPLRRKRLLAPPVKASGPRGKGGGFGRRSHSQADAERTKGAVHCAPPHQTAHTKQGDTNEEQGTTWADRSVSGLLSLWTLLPCRTTLLTEAVPSCRHNGGAWNWRRETYLSCVMRVK
jgi:hypothetical protein